MKEVARSSPPPTPLRGDTWPWVQVGERPEAGPGSNGRGICQSATYVPATGCAYQASEQAECGCQEEAHNQRQIKRPSQQVLRLDFLDDLEQSLQLMGRPTVPEDRRSA